MGFQHVKRWFDRKKETLKISRRITWLLEPDVKRMKHVRYLFRDVGKGLLLSLEISKDGEMRGELRAAIKRTQLSNNASKSFAHCTSWYKPEMERTHKTTARTLRDERRSFIARGLDDVVQWNAAQDMKSDSTRITRGATPRSRFSPSFVDGQRRYFAVSQYDTLIIEAQP